MAALKTFVATVVTAGTPVPLTAVPTLAWWARIEKAAGSGLMYIGESGLNKATLAKVGKVFSNTNPPDFVEIDATGGFPGLGPFDLNKLYVDADTNNRQVVGLYIPSW